MMTTRRGRIALLVLVGGVMGITIVGSGPAVAQIGDATDEPQESVDQVGDTASDATDEVGDAADGLRDGAGGATDGVTGGAGGTVGTAAGSTSDGAAAGDVTGSGGTILDGAPGVGARSADLENSAAATASSHDADDVAAGGDEVIESEAPPAAELSGLCVGFAESFCADLVDDGLTGLLYESFDAGGELLSAVTDALPLSGLDLFRLIVIAAVLGLAGAVLVRRDRRAPADT